MAEICIDGDKKDLPIVTNLAPVGSGDRPDENDTQGDSHRSLMLSDVTTGQVTEGDGGGKVCRRIFCSDCRSRVSGGSSTTGGATRHDLNLAGGTGRASIPKQGDHCHPFHQYLHDERGDGQQHYPEEKLSHEKSNSNMSNPNKPLENIMDTRSHGHTQRSEPHGDYHGDKNTCLHDCKCQGSVGCYIDVNKVDQRVLSDPRDLPDVVMDAAEVEGTAVNRSGHRLTHADSSLRLPHADSSSSLRLVHADSSSSLASLASQDSKLEKPIRSKRKKKLRGNKVKKSSGDAPSEGEGDDTTSEHSCSAKTKKRVKRPRRHCDIHFPKVNKETSCDANNQDGVTDEKQQMETGEIKPDKLVCTCGKSSKRSRSKVRPEPEGGSAFSPSQGSFVDEFDRVIFSNDPIFSDMEYDAKEDAQIRCEMERYHKRSNHPDIFSAAQMVNTNTMLKFAIIGAELQNISGVSLRRVKFLFSPNIVQTSG